MFSNVLMCNNNCMELAYQDGWMCVDGCHLMHDEGFHCAVMSV